MTPRDLNKIGLFRQYSLARVSLLAWLEPRGRSIEDYAFPGRIDDFAHMRMRNIMSCAMRIALVLLVAAAGTSDCDQLCYDLVNLVDIHSRVSEPETSHAIHKSKQDVSSQRLVGFLIRVGDIRVIAQY